jgi:hypothetical protein
MSSRKPHDVVAPRLRIRESLRRRLELAAKKRNVSLSREMSDRLTASFEVAEISQIAVDLNNTYERLAVIADLMAKNILSAE